MTSMKASYKGDLRTEAIHLKSGNTIITDAPLDNNGKGEAFSPTDLVCASLSSCMMTLMGIVAKRDGIDLNGLDSEITKIMSTDPRKISEIHIHFTWKEPVTDPVIIQKLKRAALTCPVALSLHPEIRQEITFNF
jgi:putative redox protein